MLSHLFDVTVHVLAIVALVLIALLIVGLISDHHEKRNALKAASNPDQPELPVEPPKPKPQIVINHKTTTKPARTQLELSAPPARSIGQVPNLALERYIRRLPDDAA